jgi:hypothetical protein
MVVVFDYVARERGETISVRHAIISNRQHRRLKAFLNRSAVLAHTVDSREFFYE